MSGKEMDPDDKQEFINQVNSEPDEWMMICKAYPPKVTIQNDIFPRAHEVYNCTSCTNGEPEHPAHKLKSNETYRVKCKWNLQWNEGPRWNDIACPKWDRRVKVPKHGFMPGVESGVYDKNDRR